MESDTISRCGEQCCRFIICRGAFGIPFQVITGWKPHYMYNDDDEVLEDYNDTMLSKKKKFEYI